MEDEAESVSDDGQYLSPEVQSVCGDGRYQSLEDDEFQEIV
jgi:hypothetical protein